MMDTSPNYLGMDSSCTLAIQKPMKMTPNRAVRTGLGILDAMGDLNQGLLKRTPSSRQKRARIKIDCYTDEPKYTAAGV